jgi:hypothetical protein
LSEAFEVGLCGIELWEQALVGLKLAGVDAAAACFDADGMFEVEHLVIEKIFDGAARSVGAIEDPADDDGVVRCVVVTQHAAGVVGAPGQGGAAKKTVKETDVERLEDFVEIVVMACRCRESFPATGLADVFRLSRYGLRGDMTAIAVRVQTRDRFPVKLREQDVGDGVMDCFRCGFKQVGEADVKRPFAEADGGVERGEAAETDVERGNGSTRAKFAILLLEDGYQRDGRGLLLFPRRLFLSGMQCRLRSLVEESGRRRWRWRKQLQKLTQRGWAGMLRCGQGLVLAPIARSFVYQDDFIRRDRAEWKR